MGNESQLLRARMVWWFWEIDLKVWDSDPHSYKASCSGNVQNSSRRQCVLSTVTPCFGQYWVNPEPMSVMHSCSHLKVTGPQGIEATAGGRSRCGYSRKKVGETARSMEDKRWTGQLTNKLNNRLNGGCWRCWKLLCGYHPQLLLRTKVMLQWQEKLLAGEGRKVEFFLQIEQVIYSCGVVQQCCTTELGTLLGKELISLKQV